MSEPTVRPVSTSSMKDLLVKMRSAPDPLTAEPQQLPEMFSPRTPKLPSASEVSEMNPQQKAALRENVNEALVHLKSLFRSLQAIHEAAK